MTQQSALKRLKQLNQHCSPTKDLYRELVKCSFDFDLAVSAYQSIRPKQFDQTIAVMDDICEGTYADEPPKDELRIHTNKLCKRYLQEWLKRGIFTEDQLINDPDFINRCTMQVGNYLSGVATKFAVQLGLYAKSLKNLGTKIHEDALRKGAMFQEMGCFWLTELGHGSDVSKIETTAHFDPEGNQFIINSPTETSIKFWIGNLGKTACMAVVFAQLITERVKQGVHGFLVQIRDKQNHRPLPGLEIGDWGDKIGLQHVDNGWIRFDNYRVPKSALLNRFCDVTSDGVYFSLISDKNKRMAFQLGSLSGGRIAIAQVASNAGLAALTTAIRFQWVRKQFKSQTTKEEVLLFDYQINQHRLLTHFCKNYIFNVANMKIAEIWDENLPNNLDPKNKNSSFMHLISSIWKAYNTFEAFTAVDEARQAMGGMGYSWYSGLNALITISDLNRTWEGDNNVLYQQAGRLLLKNLSNLLTGKQLMPTCEFIQAEMPEPETFKGAINNLQDLIGLITFKALTLIHQTGARLQMAHDKGAEWDKVLKYYVYPMVKSYYDRFVLKNYLEFLKKLDSNKATRLVFERMAVIYAQNVILEDSEFYRDTLTAEHIMEIKEDIFAQLKELRQDIIPIIATLHFKDRMVGVMSAGDMNLYQRFMSQVRRTKGVYSRAEEWKYLYE